jgi:hypothetical protein
MQLSIVAHPQAASLPQIYLLFAEVCFGALKQPANELNVNVLCASKVNVSALAL